MPTESLNTRSENRHLGRPPYNAGFPGVLIGGRQALFDLKQSRFLQSLGIAMTLAALTVTMTYPAALHLRSMLIGGEGDSFTFVWNLWWVKRALLELHTNPYRTTLLFHPHVFELSKHTLALGLGVLSIPLQALISPLFAYNVLALAGVWLTGVCTYLFLRTLRIARAPALFGSMVFMFAPTYQVRLYGHLNLLHAWPIPLTLAWYAMWQRTGRFRFAFLAAATWAFSFMVIEYYTLFIGLVLGFFAVADTFFPGRSRRSGRSLGQFAVVVCIFLCLVTPDLWLRRTALSAPERLTSFGRPYSVDLLGFVTPSGTHSLIGDTVRQITGGKDAWHDPQGNAGESTAFIGFSVITLCLFALWRAPRRLTVPWVVLSALFAIMALGPVLHVAGRFGWDVSGTQFEPLIDRLAPVYSAFGIQNRVLGIPLPYLVFQKLPFLNAMRTPGRWFLITMLGCTVLAAIGGAELYSSLRGKTGTKLNRLAFHSFWPALMMLTLLEYVAVPKPLTSPVLPSAYEIFVSDKSDFAVVEVPIADWLTMSRAMYYQTIHQKKLVRAAVSRSDDLDLAFIRSSPMLSKLLEPQYITCSEGSVRLDDLLENSIRYIVVHDEAVRTQVTALGGDPRCIYELLDRDLERVFWESDGISVYRVY